LIRIFVFFRRPAAFLILCAVLTAAFGDESTTSEIPQLIRQLGSHRWSERTKARRQLVLLGLGALPALRDACDNADPEIASQARRAIKQIWEIVGQRGLRERLTAFPGDAERLERLLKHIPNLYNILLESTPQLRTDSSLRYALLDRLEEMRSSDTAPVLVELIYSEKSSLRQRATLLLAATSRNSIVDRMKLLFASPEPEIVIGALYAAAATRSRLAEKKLLKMLDHHSNAVAVEAAGALLNYYGNPTGYAALRTVKTRLSLDKDINVRLALKKLADRLSLNIVIDAELEESSATIDYDSPAPVEGKLRDILPLLVRPLGKVDTRLRYGVIYVATLLRHAALPEYDPAELAAEGDRLKSNALRNLRINADFHNTHLKTALVEVTAEVDLDLKVHPETDLGNIKTFAFFNKVTVENALRCLLFSRGLGYYLDGKTLHILPLRLLDARLEARREKILSGDDPKAMLVYLDNPDAEFAARARLTLISLCEDAVAAAVRHFGADVLEKGTEAHKFMAASYLSSLSGSHSIKSALEKTVAFIADDLPLGTVLERLSGYVGIPFTLGFSPSVGKKLEEIRVTCKADIITVREAVEQVILETGLVYRTRENDVFFSTPEDLADYATAGALMQLIESEYELVIPLLNKLTGRSDKGDDKGLAELKKWWESVRGY